MSTAQISKIVKSKLEVFAVYNDSLKTSRKLKFDLCVGEYKAETAAKIERSINNQLKKAGIVVTSAKFEDVVRPGHYSFNGTPANKKKAFIVRVPLN